MNKIDLQALTLAGPLRHKPVLDPLAVHLLENRLSIYNAYYFAVKRRDRNYTRSDPDGLRFPGQEFSQEISQTPEMCPVFQIFPLDHAAFQL